MRQQERGKKILKPRNEKGLTQEELVEKCNISVRTLQRIKTGEVTHRVITISAILTALDYCLSTIAENEDTGARTPVSILRKFLLPETDSADSLSSQLTIAWGWGFSISCWGCLKGQPMSSGSGKAD